MELERSAAGFCDGCSFGSQMFGNKDVIPCQNPNLIWSPQDSFIRAIISWIVVGVGQLWATIRASWGTVEEAVELATRLQSSHALLWPTLVVATFPD